MSYLSEETGAVTVDWVVLTAGLVGLGLAAMAVVSSGAEDISQDIDNQLSANGLITTTFAQSTNRGLYQAYLTYYEANGWNGVEADFAAEVAQYETMSNEDLVAQIQNDVANYASYQASAAAMKPFADTDDQWLTMALWYGADDMTGPEFRGYVVSNELSGDQTVDDYAAAMTSEMDVMVAIGDHAREVADERGLNY